MGRSIRREVSISFSDGRPSRLKKSTGDLAGRVGSFLIIHGQREEILSRLDVLLADDGDQHHGVVHVYHDGAVSLACNFAGFERQRVAPVVDGFPGYVQEGSL